jgi:hypothetical protein
MKYPDIRPQMMLVIILIIIKTDNNGRYNEGSRERNM